jgi:tetratricopeptide (TPR) repeat protein
VNDTNTPKHSRYEELRPLVGEHWSEFFRFITTGEASDEFLEVLDRDRGCQEALEAAYQKQVADMRDVIPPSPVSGSEAAAAVATKKAVPPLRPSVRSWGPRVVAVASLAAAICLAVISVRLYDGLRVAQGERDQRIASLEKSQDALQKSQDTLEETQLALKDKNEEYDQLNTDHLVMKKQAEQKIQDAYRPDNAAVVLGTFLYKQGDFPGAIASYDQAAKINPDNADAFQYRGFARYQMKDYQNAIADLTKAAELDPDNSNAHTYVGMSHLKMGRPQEAMTSLKRAVIADPKNAAATSALATCLLAVPDADKQNMERAVEVVVRHGNLTDWQDKRPLDLLFKNCLQNGHAETVNVTMARALLELPAEKRSGLEKHIEILLDTIQPKSEVPDPGDEGPADDGPPVEAPTEEAPAEEAPEEGAPGEEAPEEEAPAEEGPAEVDEIPAPMPSIDFDDLLPAEPAPPESGAGLD